MVSVHRLRRSFVLLAGTALGFSPAAPAQTPIAFRNMAPSVRYVGSKVCSGCHPKIASSYLKTGMGRSMITGGDTSFETRLPAPATIFDKDTGQYFEVLRKDGALYQAHYAVGRDGREIFRQTFKTDYVVGAGENGFGFVIARDDYLFEAPLSYYTKSRIWSFSPGYEAHNYAFTRPVVEQCIGCHSGQPQPVSGRVALYRNPPFAELAVGCENCHGPGALHVTERQAGGPPVNPAAKIDTSIVNPARLTGWLADNICMKCHQGGDVRVAQPGKTEQDFRPGSSLDTVEAIFKVPLSSDSPPQSVLLEHYFGMRLSKCYRKSAGKLGCITCHNPHAQLFGQEAVLSYRAKCLTCHTPESCKLPVAERVKKSSADDCAFCHMPKRTVATITHAALTDHSITARAGEPYPEEAFSSNAADGTGLLHLTSAPGGPISGIPPITLLRAYLDLIRDGHKEFTARKNELLDKLARSAPADPLVLSALGRRAAAKGTVEGARESIGYLTGAIRTGSTLPEDFLLLAEAYGQCKRHAEGIRVLQKGLDQNPYLHEFYDALAAQYVALEEYRDALQMTRKGLDVFPDDTALLMLQKKVQAAMLDTVR